MIDDNDVSNLFQYYPSGSTSTPHFAVTGGTSVMCWLRSSGSVDRPHSDIDLIAFTNTWLEDSERSKLDRNPFFIGVFNGRNIASSAKEASVNLQIIHNRCFDFEVVPRPTDIRRVSFHATDVLTLSAEYIFLAKLAFTNVHRTYDLWDALMLNRCGLVQDDAYLFSLLEQTTFAEFTDISRMKQLITFDDLQLFLDDIHRQVIRRFLYWPYVYVEMLHYNMLFTLIDESQETLQLPDEVVLVLNNIVDFGNRNLPLTQIINLGFCFLLSSLPKRGIELLDGPNIHTQFSTWKQMALRYPRAWLTHCKSIRILFRQIIMLESQLNCCFTWLWDRRFILPLLHKLLVYPAARYGLLSKVQGMNNEALAQPKLWSNHEAQLKALLLSIGVSGVT